MIDLSFLTGEEQETIQAVLKRDAELKKAEEQRVQNLQKTVRDKGRLRYMTGEWFYETKQLRHQDRIHGSEIIRASIRHFHKPLTILEPSQLMPEKPCSVSSENKEVFVPPALCGFLQEQLSDERYENIKPCETPEDTPTTVLHLPTRRRQNPFNSDIIESHSCENKDSQSMDRSVDPTPTQHEEPLPSSDSCISYATNLKQDPTDKPITQNASTTMPMIEKKPVPSSQDCFVEEERPGGQQSSSVVPRGILKHLYAFSSTDSLSCLDLQSAVSLNSLTNRWIDRKQVSFSSTVSHSGVEWQDRKELGENRLLDFDSFTPSEVENKCELEDTGRATVCTHRPLLNPSQVDLQEGGVNCKTEANIQEAGQEASQQLVDVSKHCISEFPSPSVSKLILVEQSGKPVQLETDHDSETRSTDYLTGCNILHQKLPEERTNVAVEDLSDIKLSNCGLMGTSSTVSPKSKPGLLGIFRGEKENTTEVQSQKEDEVKIVMQKEPGNTQNLCQGVANRTTDKPGSFIQEAKPSETTEVVTQQVTSFQNTPFEETVTSVDSHQEATESRVIQLSERLSNLKALWEREKSSPKIVFTTEEERQKDDSKSGVEAPHGYQTNFDVASMKTNMSPQKEIKVDDTADKSPQSDSSFFVDLFKEDGTYRANPVIIYEETHDSLTGSVRNSKISEPQDNVIIPVPSCLALNTQNLERDFQIPLPSQSSSSPQEDRPAKISKAKHFLEKEYKGPMVIAVDSRISILNIKDVSQQSDLRTSLDIREESDEEAKAAVSYGSTGDVKSACHQYQVKADTEYQERPLSLRQSHTSRPKNQNDEIRRSPSKTCHPRVLPRESFSPKKCKLEGSSLKAFPIDINPQSKFVEEQQGKPTTVPRQEKSLLTETKPGVGITSQPLPPHPEDRGAYLVNVNTHQCSSSSSNTPPSKKKLLTLQSLVRSFIPQDKQPFLWPKVESDVPLLHQDRATIALQSPQNADFVGNHSDSPIEGNLRGISSWIVQNNDGNASQNTTAWSLSRISSGSYDDGSSPILSAFKRFSSRCTSSSKSLENLFLQTTSTLSSSKQMKTGMSMTVLQQEENDSDSTFETNLGWRRNTGSSTSNFSLSSGMASVSGSICSLYPEDFGDIEVHGSIHFALNYIQKLKEFHIFVVDCRDLAVADNKKNCSDPYVKCYLLPDKTKLGKRKTTVKKNTLNPTYNEILKFKIVSEVFKTQSLNISVWHSNTFGQNSFLGEVHLDMSDWDFNNTHINEYALKNKVSGQSTRASPAHLMDSRGQMRVALRYLPQMSHSKRTSRMETGEVQIWVKDCKNLPPVRGIVTDPFVKCTILPDISKKSRQKTRVVKRAANPMFNHTMVYDGVRLEHLKEACVEMTVWDHDRLNNHYIGGLRLGLGTGKSYGVEVDWMDSTTDEANLWQRMLHSDGEWVEDDLPLRMLVMVKK